MVESVVDYAIFMLDTQGRVATWNLGAERIKGYTADEILGQHFSKFYPHDDVAAGKPERQLKRACDEGRSVDEGWRVRKDGTLFWARVVITCLRSETGEHVGYAKITRDLTEQREAQEALRRSEERLHHLVDAATEHAIFMLDATGRVETWNTGAERIKGYAAHEIVGRHFSVFYPEADRAQQKPDRILQIVREQGRYFEEGWRVRKNGARFWAEVTITAMRGEHGELSGFVKVTRDMSERRKNEDALRRSEERFRLLIDGVTDYAIFMLDAAGRVATWNRGAERLKGYTVDEVLGRHLSLFFPAEDIAAGKPERELLLAAEHGRFEDEGWRIRKDGSRFWANVVLTALRDATGELTGFAKVTRDLTARREAEATERRLVREQTLRETAERSARDALEANRIRDEFLATVSHELRTPLTALLGWATVLREQQLDSDLATRAREAIVRNAKAQSRIVDDILDVSRIITGKLQIEPRQADLVRIVEQALEVVRPSADAKSIAIRFQSAASNGQLIGDPDRILQVVWNLLSNAIKFTESGGSIDIRIERTPSHLSLTVADTGAGIPPEFLAHVFDRFSQADSSSTRRVGGLGLGLAIVRHIVELHGGTVNATSEGPGKGATFNVSLPLRSHSPHATEEQTSPSTTPTRSGPLRAGLEGLRVLVVDDEQDTRELVELLLARAGASVEVAGSAAQALDRLQTVRPDVLVSDIGMPGEDGYMLIRRIRDLGSADLARIPSIALSAYSRPQDSKRALLEGFTAHLAKPIDPEELLAVVKNLANLSERSR